ncbi:MAG: phage tail family protein [Oscillospiraceae bacterium]|jgi:hypothetical protein|nr:phage tail family protein [Oscillospiraceae bacterium]
MELVYQGARGRIVELGAAGLPSGFVLTAARGLYDTRCDVYAIDPPGQAGAVWVSSRVARRVITLEGFIARDVAAGRRRLASCLSPMEPGWLTLRRVEAEGLFERRIRCVVERGPIFGAEDGSAFSVTLVAPSPWWEDTGGDSGANLTGWVGGVAFPWGMEEGFQFGGRTPDTAVNVFNPGDALTGLTIRMYAADVVERPYVARPGTAEALRVAATLEEGGSIEIGTGAGEKYARRVYADGSVENAMRYIDPDSVFPQLEPGDNLLKAGAVSGGEALTVTLSFRPRYLSA